MAKKQGIRVAKPNIDVSSTNPEDLLYTSEYLSPKVYKKATGTVKLDSAGTAVVFVDHDLGYIPVAFVYHNPTLSIINGPTFGSYPMPTSWGFADNNFVFSSSYRTNIRIDFFTSSALAGKVVNYVCYIFVEQASG